MNEWLINIFNANTLAAITATGVAIWWVIHRSFSQEAQIKNLGTKIDHIDQKLDMSMAQNKARMDRMEDNMKRMDNLHREDMKLMDAKWERLFERLLIQDQQKSK